MSNNKSQLVVIGAGPGGYVAAFLAADNGLEVTLIDSSERPGGICLQKGCIPSKALLHAARIIEETKEAKEFGIEFSEPNIDIDKLRSFKDNVINKLTSGLVHLCKQRKVNYIQGKASFASSTSVKVIKSDNTEEIIEFENAILATGSKPVKLPGLDFTSKVMDSTIALNLENIPKTLLVVGGGYIGLEIGSVYAALGSDVSVVEMSDSLIPNADKDLVRPLSRKLKDSFSEILLNTKADSITENDAGVSVAIGDEKKEYDKVLIAIGRKPCFEDLGLDNTNIELDDKNFIKTDAQRKTTEPNIYAIGDITGEPMLAHKASAEAKTAIYNILGKDSSFEPKAIPAVAFTDPEIAWCGLTEEEAKAKGIDFEVAKFPWAASGRALSLARTEGMTKLIIDPSNEKILGVGIVGVGAGELISEGVVAIEMDATVSDLANCIHPHPTLSETLMESAEVFHGKSPSIYKPKK